MAGTVVRKGGKVDIQKLKESSDRIRKKKQAKADDAEVKRLVRLFKSFGVSELKLQYKKIDSERSTKIAAIESKYKSKMALIKKLLATKKA